MSEKNTTKYGLVKTVIFASTLITGVILGEQTKPLQTAKDFITYYNVGSEDGTPQDYTNYETQIIINEKGRAELYFGNKETRKYRQVKEDGTVGNIGEQIDIYLNHKKDQFNDWYNDLKKAK